MKTPATTTPTLEERLRELETERLDSPIGRPEDLSACPNLRGHFMIIGAIILIGLIVEFWPK